MPGREDVFQKAINAGHSAAWDQDWQKAASLYSSALDEFPDNPLALSSLGLAYFEMQNYENSLICYQHAARVAHHAGAIFVRLVPGWRQAQDREVGAQLFGGRHGAESRGGLGGMSVAPFSRRQKSFLVAQVCGPATVAESLVTSYCTALRSSRTMRMN